MKSLKLLITAFAIITICNRSHAQTIGSRLIAKASYNYNSTKFTLNDSEKYIYSVGNDGHVFLNGITSWEYIGKCDTLYQTNYDRSSIFSYKRKIQKYDPHRNVIDQTWQDYDIATGNWINDTRYKYMYDTDQNQIMNLEQIWNTYTNSWGPFYKKAYTYDANHNQITDTENYNLTGKWEYYSLTKNTYDVHNNLTSSTLSGWDPSSGDWLLSGKSIYYLNADSHPDSVCRYKWNDTTSTWKINSKNAYRYDIHKNLQTDTTYNTISGPFNYEMVLNYSYNSINDKISMEFLSYDKISGTWVKQDTIIYTYDSNHNISNLIKEVWQPTTNNYKNAIRETNAYNSFNQIVSSKTNSWDDATNKWGLSNSDQIFYFYYERYTDVQYLNNIHGSIQLYPSPASNVLHIDLQWNMAQSSIIHIYDMNGRQWYQVSISSFSKYKTTIPVANYPAGNYLITISGQTGQLSKVFSVVH